MQLEATPIDGDTVPMPVTLGQHDRLSGEGDHCDRGHDWVVESMDVLACDLALATSQFAG